MLIKALHSTGFLTSIHVVQNFCIKIYIKTYIKTSLFNVKGAQVKFCRGAYDEAVTPLD
jgi:hypothetical protein